MCGIAGVIRMGKEKISDDTISLLLTGNEHRGNDSTGIAISQNDGSLNILKEDIPAWRFVTGNAYKEFLKEYLRDDSWAVMLHTRGASQGTPRDNRNNHPMYSGKSAIVHNGQIHNDGQLFHQIKMDRGAETDSDIIRAFVDKFGITEDCIHEMNKINGSAAGSAISPDYPKRLLLFRSGSPMTLGSNENFFAWSSEKTTLHKAMRPWIVRFKMYFQDQKPDIAFSAMADDSAYIMGENGLEFHGKFKALSGAYTEPFRRTYEGYAERTKRWDAEARYKSNQASNLVTIDKANKKKKDNWDDAYCLRCKRYFVITKGHSPTDYFCNQAKGGCGDRLFAPPVVTVVN